jgi:uncharacterized protein
VCVYSETCGLALTVEHNGDLYSCDHYVEPDYLLGNITETPMIELIASDQQRQFGLDKRETLPQYCLDCEVRFACHGGCPRNRFTQTPDGEPGLNYLCPSYRSVLPAHRSGYETHVPVAQTGPGAVRDRQTRYPAQRRLATQTH